MTTEPTSRRPTWHALRPADLRRGDEDPEVRALLRDMVSAALRGDSLAYRKLGDMFRSLFYASAARIASAADMWWRREELATDFLTFLLTPVRPSLREAPARAEQDRERRERGTNKFALPPLANWLEGDNESLMAFVSVTIANVCQDLVRRGRVQDRLGSTGEQDRLDVRSDIDAPLIPTPFRTGPSVYEAERAVLDTEQERLFALAVQSLSDQEFKVLSGIRNGQSQQEIAAQIGKSDGRVTQIKQKAVSKLLAALARLGLNSKGDHQ